MGAVRERCRIEVAWENIKRDEAIRGIYSLVEGNTSSEATCVPSSPTE